MTFLTRYRTRRTHRARARRAVAVLALGIHMGLPETGYKAAHTILKDPS